MKSFSDRWFNIEIVRRRSINNMRYMSVNRTPIVPQDQKLIMYKTTG